MKVIYTSDLHGDTYLYQRLLDLSGREKADVLIIGGDILPKKYEFMRLVKIQRNFIENELFPLFSSFRAENPEAQIYLMMGNDDFAINMDLLEEMDEGGIIKLIHNRVHHLYDEFFVAGYGCVPLTIFSLKDWERFDDKEQQVADGSFGAYISTDEGLMRIDVEKWGRARPTVEEDLRELVSRSDPQRTIYVMHAPPYGTSLDKLYNGYPAGSRAIRRFILDHQPYLTLHGHIHESPRVSGRYTDTIGSTISVNPGQGVNFHAAIFELSDPRRTMWHTIFDKNVSTTSRIVKKDPNPR